MPRPPLFALLLHLLAGAAAKLVPIRVPLAQSAVLPGLAALESALEDHGGDTTGILLTLEQQQDGEAAVAMGGDKDEEEEVRFTQSIRSAMRRCRFPVIAVADGCVTGALASVFLASPYRICTSRARYAVDSCRRGEIPGPSALEHLAALSEAEPHIALATALGALDLRAHDMTATHLATHFAPREALPDLRAELLSSPADYYDVPIARRCSKEAPPHLVPLYAAEKAAPLHGALYAAFGPHVKSVAELVERLDAQRRIARDHAAQLANEPCGIHIRTRERADAVRDALDAAGSSLSTSCPSVLEETFAAFRTAIEERHSAPSRVRRSSTR